VKPLYPQQVTTNILLHLMERVWNYKYPNAKMKAVITVPATFTQIQLKAVKEAAELCGIQVIKLVSEPVAAAVAAVVRNNLPNGVYLIFDWGGGTFDVSVISIVDSSFKVLSVDGDSLLGGRDVDEILFSHCLNILKEKYQVSLEIGSSDTKQEKKIKKGIEKLKSSVHLAKLKLSTQESCTIDYNDEEDVDIQILISRDELENLLIRKRNREA